MALTSEDLEQIRAMLGNSVGTLVVAPTAPVEEKLTIADVLRILVNSARLPTEKLVNDCHAAIADYYERDDASEPATSASPA